MTVTNTFSTIFTALRIWGCLSRSEQRLTWPPRKHWRTGQNILRVAVLSIAINTNLVESARSDYFESKINSDLEVLYVQGDLNGRRLNLIIDTASTFLILDKSMESALGDPLSPEVVSKITGFPPESQILSTHFGNVKSDYFSFPKLKIGSLALRGVVCSTIDLQILSEAHGVKIDGIIGVDQVRDLNIEVNFDQNTLNIFDYNYNDVASKYDEYVELFPGPGGAPAIIVQAGASEFAFVIDTGLNISGTIEPNVQSYLKSTKLISGSSVRQLATVNGAVSRGIYRLKKIEIGNQGYAGLIFSDGSWNSLGFQFLHRNNFILSLPNRKLYLSRRKSIIENDPIDRSGISLISKNGEILIFGIDKQSPAAGAGLQVGDQIFSINERNVSANNLRFARRAFEGSEGEVVEIGFKRANISASVKLTLSAAILD